MSTIVILPGIGGSDEMHWQTRWEAGNPKMARFQPASWTEPDLNNWIKALDDAVAKTEEPPLLVAHSLACLLVMHWAAKGGRLVRGAFLVAIPDPTGRAFPAEAASFKNPPGDSLPFPALVVGSTNDPYGSIEYARGCASQLQAGFVTVGSLGHISSTSGLGAWQPGADLLMAFAAGTRRV